MKKVKASSISLEVKNSDLAGRRKDTPIKAEYRPEELFEFHVEKFEE